MKASSSYDQVPLPRSLALMWPEAMPWGWSRELEEVEKMKPVLGCAQAGADGHPLRKGWKETRRASGGRRRWVLLNRKSGKQWETEMRIKVKMLRRAQALLNPACLSLHSSHAPLAHPHPASQWSPFSCSVYSRSLRAFAHTASCTQNASGSPSPPSSLSQS